MPIDKDVNLVHQFWEMSRIVLNREAEVRHKKELSRGFRILILIVAITLAMVLLELLHRGTTAYILSLIKTTLSVFWDIFRNIAAVFRDFINWVDHQRS